jgi:hypothetical protein
MKRPLLLGGGAFGLAAGLAAYPVLAAGPASASLIFAGGSAALLYLAALSGLWRGALGLAIALLALEYLGSLYLRGGGLDLEAPAYAAALFTSAELGWLTLEAAAGNQPWLGRLMAIGGVGLGGATLGFGLLLTSLLPAPGGTLLTAAGAAAGIAVFAVLAWLARAYRLAELQF